MIRIPKKTVEHCEDPRTIIPPGRYLLEIIDVEGTDASEYLLIKYRTIHPEPGLVGEEKFHLSHKAIKRLAILVKRAGLVTRGDPDDDALDVDPTELLGMQWVVDLTNEEFEGKRGEMIKVNKWDGFSNFWPPEHDEVRDFVRSLSRTTRPAPAPQARPLPVPPMDDDL